MIKDRAKFPLIVLLLLLAAAILFAVTLLSRTNLENAITQRAQEALGVYQANLEAEISKYEVMPRLLSRNPVFSNFLANSRNGVQLSDANLELQRLNDILGTLDVFLLDKSGMTVAASNWNQEYTYIGEDLSFRPYYREAINKESARYFALGTTSVKRGYYFSATVRDLISEKNYKNPTKTLGVLVVKVDLAQLEAAWSGGAEMITVTDSDGIFFISTNPEWLYRSRYPLSEADLERIKLSRRFSDIELRQLEITEINRNKSHIEPRFCIVAPASAAASTYLMQSVALPSEGWEIQIWSDLASVDSQVKRAQVIALLSLLTTGLGIALFIHRRRARIAQQQFEQKSHDELQAAYGEMEHRVAERTAELSTSNQRLYDEINERTQTEEELRTTQDNLVQAAKMAALGQMATSITHELNQPLSAVRTFADTAQTYIERGEVNEAQENLQIISRMTVRMGEIMHHLKTFARKTPLELGPINLQYVIDETLLILKTQIQRTNISVNQSGNAGNIAVIAEQVRLQQVITNLLQNAIDVLADAPVREILIKVTEEDEGVAISVSDSGPGLSDSQSGKIFEPFFTTKPVGDGLGLGLAITYGIMKDFGGSIAVRNGANGGAEFSLYLKTPRNSEKAVA